LDSLGTHLLLDLKGCNAELLDDLDYVRSVVVAAAREAGATIVGDTFHKFHPIGVTGIVAIAESHIGIHTWPEFHYAAADIFTCGEDFRAHQAAESIVENLNCGEPSITEIRRGFVVPLTTAAV
jgi:S-adenosylmethionine decarboxylase proenzyme